MPNMNPETGIPYGVIALNSLADWVFDEFFDKGTDETYAAALAEWEAEHPDDDPPDDFGEWIDEAEYSLETPEGLKLGLSYLGGAPLVWVFESPHTTVTRACSPCVPGAGDLDSPGDGVRCYTLPLEWFADAREGVE